MKFKHHPYIESRNIFVLKKYLLIWTVVILGTLFGGCLSPSNGRNEILVFAAASLIDVMSEVENIFEAQSDTKVTLSLGGSQELATQIDNGAPADLLIPAGELPLEFLANKNLIEGEIVNLLSNKLVVVMRSDSAQIESVGQIVTDKIRRVAIANPDLAPGGWYAKEAFINLGIWDKVEKKLVMGADVRVTLSYVESGNVDLAVVYLTDVAMARNIDVLDLVPRDSYSQIIYPAVMIRKSRNQEHAAKFMEFLQSDVASSIFSKHGFELIEP